MICDRISFEILCEIFRLLCHKPISLHVLDNSSRFGQFPWAVGQVCKRWRAVFLSYPRLWTSLSLRYHPTDILGVDRLHEMSRRTLLYLERSNQLPLTITVYNSAHEETSNSIESFPRTTWKLLLSCSGRWEKVYLVLCHEPPLLDLLRCEMPIVKSLKLHTHISYDSHFQFCHPFNTTAPRLVKLHLSGWLEKWVFPWSQLTKVQMPVANSDLHVERLEIVLSQLQNVEELRMSRVAVLSARPKSSSSPIRLPSLRVLAVSVYIHEILALLEAPLLEDLWVEGRPVGRQHCSLTFTEELSLSIHRSSCHIRKLTLQNGERQLLPNLMKLVSGVEVLCIKMTISGRGSFLAEHITQMDNGVYLPNLRELKMSCLLGEDDDEKIMTAMSRNEKSRLISVRREDVSLMSKRVRMFMSFK